MKQRRTNLSISGEPTTQPGWRTYIPALQRFVDDQDYNLIRQLFQECRYSELPCHIYEYDGLQIEFQLYPKLRARGSRDIRPTGVIMEEIKMSDNHTILRGKIHEKGKKYGRLNKPLIIAVSHLHLLDRIDIIQALFGDEQFFLSCSSNRPISNEDLVFKRKLNGLWRKYKRVSGLLVVCGLTPWVTTEADICLYQNPWVTYPCPSGLSVFPQVVVQNNQFIYEDGESLQSLLRLNAV
jgi:hypothetical protein